MLFNKAIILAFSGAFALVAAAPVEINQARDIVDFSFDGGVVAREALEGLEARGLADFFQLNDNQKKAKNAQLKNDIPTEKLAFNPGSNAQLASSGAGGIRVDQQAVPGKNSPFIANIQAQLNGVTGQKSSIAGVRIAKGADPSPATIKAKLAHSINTGEFQDIAAPVASKKQQPAVSKTKGPKRPTIPNAVGRKGKKLL